MAYSTTITALDLSSGVPDVRVTAGYTWTEVGGPTAVERTQDEVSQDIASTAFLGSAGTTFSYAGDLAPPPSPAWFIALWIQEIPRIANGTGWLFRSGRFTTEPPTDPIEVILAPEQLIGAAELSMGIGTLPLTSGSTTITGVTLTIVGTDIALTAVGTDTQLPAGVTFTYGATMQLIPNGSLQEVDSPFDIRLSNETLGFTAGVGTGFTTAILNLVSGLILANISPRIESTLKGQINSGVLSSVATRLNRGVPSTMPAGVVLSIRAVRSTTRPLAGGTEPVIGVRAALAAFGGVLNKFPALTTGSSTCFVATAALGPDAPELAVLRSWRDLWLRQRPGGTRLIRTYERVSPPLARRIAGSSRLRAGTRLFVVAPMTMVARTLLGRSNRREPS